MLVDITFEEVCINFMRASRSKKLTTIDVDRIRNVLIPIIGRRRFVDIEFNNILNEIEKYTENGIFTINAKYRSELFAKTSMNLLLAKLLDHARRRGLRIKSSINRDETKSFKLNKYLTDQEYRRFGQALEMATDSSIWAPALSAIYFMAISGWSREEVLNLRSCDIERDTCIARIDHPRRGVTYRPLSKIACYHLKETLKDDDYAFPSRLAGSLASNFDYYWRRLATYCPTHRLMAPGFLRKSAIYIAKENSFEVDTLTTLFSYSGRSETTMRDQHKLASVRAAADFVATEIQTKMSGLQK